LSHLWGCAKHIGSFIQFVNLHAFIIFYQSCDFIHCWFLCQHNPPKSSVICSRRTQTLSLPFGLVQFIQQVSPPHCHPRKTSFKCLPLQIQLNGSN